MSLIILHCENSVIRKKIIKNLSRKMNPMVYASSRMFIDRALSALFNYPLDSDKSDKDKLPKNSTPFRILNALTKSSVSNYGDIRNPIKDIFKSEDIHQIIHTELIKNLITKNQNVITDFITHSTPLRDLESFCEESGIPFITVKVRSKVTNSNIKQFNSVLEYTIEEFIQIQYKSSIDDLVLKCEKALKDIKQLISEDTREQKVGCLVT